MSASSLTHLTRRQWLLGSAASLSALPAWANTGKSGRGIVVAQIVDTSPQQQDVSRDFLIGARAAWQDLNSRGGLRGVPVQHLPLEVDGSPASVRQALARAAALDNCVVLSGSAGHNVASQVSALLQNDKLDIAHAAPWLSLPTDSRDERTFPIFANHQAQIAYVLKGHANLGLRQLGVVYASALEEALHQDDIQRSSAQLGISLQSYRGGQNLRSLGQSMGPNTPAMLLFVGGTPELAQFTQGLDKQARQRYVLGLSDINLQTLAQMGLRFQTPIIAAQAVPMVNAGTPVVRQYRQVLSRLFDEAPSPLSLSGYIAARYTQEVLADVSAPLTRANVLDAFQRRSVIDVGGFAIQSGKTSTRYVTQSMLSSEGQLIG